MKLSAVPECHEPRRSDTTEPVLPAGRAQTARAECMLMPFVCRRKLVVTWLMASTSFISDGPCFSKCSSYGSPVIQYGLTNSTAAAERSFALPIIYLLYHPLQSAPAPATSARLKTR